ncbi:hypothetical protein QO259_17330 [Salinicola sp. JS01]|uniref:hypothetical protein n=1 Tax=Salinicola sp. JS01 TaxID=3050071 RepID=UPI00255C1B50|nr:hypothetical protein [Salinicola sp. JS01]WIX32551.1 hypothetical protein QO259_17330 [Salinicola sp. JS01]
MPYVTVDVDVDLREFDTDDLAEELKKRNRQAAEPGQQSNLIDCTWDPIEGKSFNQLLDAVYEARILGKDARVLELIDRLIYSATGRIV